MKASKWPPGREPQQPSREGYLRKPPPYRRAMLAEIELPKGDFLEGGVELLPNGACREPEGPSERRESTRSATQEDAKVSFASGQPDVKVYVAEGLHNRRASKKGPLNRNGRSGKTRCVSAVARQTLHFTPSNRVEAEIGAH
mmetsp:Transcript_3151/g.5545  ORF Transcript_3151/g.5545 Transcript_3151/m.5545 type:complete len:142 (-) Transcript_3151:30-455(-)